MALRERMRAAVAPYLGPDESIQAVFGAQTRMTPSGLAGIIIFYARNQYRLVVATSERIVVLDSGQWSMAKPRGVVGELPRQTRIDSQHGPQSPVQLGAERLWVRRRFRNDIEAANAEAFGA